jgi:PII-like signaling protein
MRIPEDAVLLRIFLGESDRHHGHPLHEAIVQKARELHLAGATVLRGVMGYGRIARSTGGTFPWETCAINIAGYRLAQVG